MFVCMRCHLRNSPYEAKCGYVSTPITQEICRICSQGGSCVDCRQSNHTTKDPIKESKSISTSFPLPVHMKI